MWDILIIIIIQLDKEVCVFWASVELLFLDVAFGIPTSLFSFEISLLD